MTQDIHSRIVRNSAGVRLRRTKHEGLQATLYLTPRLSGCVTPHHAFERMRERDASVRPLTLIRRKIETRKWWLIVVSRLEVGRETVLRTSRDGKRGRYQQYAQQLAGGCALTFGDRTEAEKAKRAWQTSTPLETHETPRPRAPSRTIRRVLCPCGQRTASATELT
jgi:hypothetical protein